LLLVAAVLPAKKNGTNDDYEGRLVPKDFVALCAPQNTLRLPFWGSDSTSIQLSSILPEGTRVRAGDIVATFTFPNHEAKDFLEQRMAKVEAQCAEKQLALKRGIAALETSLAQRRIFAEMAALDLVRGSDRARMKQQQLECEARRQAFEQKALEHKLAAARANLARVTGIHAHQKDIWASYFAVFHHTKKRYTVRAPADGYLFYPHIGRKQRKAQAGDDLQSGVHFLSVVKSTAAEIVFYVPERDLKTIEPGNTVYLRLDNQSVPARITAVGYFPQRFGDVKDDYKPANAWEKCFIVKADVGATVPLGANSNIHVGRTP